MTLDRFWPLTPLAQVVVEHPPMYNNRCNRLAESFPSMYGSRGRRQDLGGLVVSLPVLAE
eukprot:COSAG01_NODE_64083_length_277_cov_22.724719_2_plen_59_part_01